ncbi:MAG: histone deacetylase [Planctomycetaceae bacterium]|nr:histone deacetylase [Planctomycetaceae bacterium]
MPLLYTDPSFLDHDTGEHRECADRLRSVGEMLKKSDVASKFKPGEIKAATLAQLGRVHSPQHIANVEKFAEKGGGRIESDTVVSPKSYQVALKAAGTAAAAVDAVIKGEHRRAMCLIRPPGHHAVPAKAQGFCLFNNVAVAAAQAQWIHQATRILVVDFDVHHGNGTQDIFYDSENVYFLSSHRHPFYPGTGTEDETGTGRGLGTIFNLPLTFGTSRKEILSRFETLLNDAAKRCKPEIVLLSAGFDAHKEDPIGSLELETEDFTKLTKQVVAVADEYCDGQLVSLLEGGYNVKSLAESVECHLWVLADK